MAIPTIGRAIPKRRYQVGEYSAVLLGDIENLESSRLVYFLALVKDGTSQPALGISFEQTTPPCEHPYCINLYTNEQEEILGYSPQSLSLDEFDQGALQTAMQVLELNDEAPYRLL